MEIHVPCRLNVWQHFWPLYQVKETVVVVPESSYIVNIIQSTFPIVKQEDRHSRLSSSDCC